MNATSRLRSGATKAALWALERAFFVARKVHPARERVTIGEFDDIVEREHLARYRFALQFCAGKTVADIACGSGYGSELLRTVAASVDSYDKESLCGNHVVDIEKQSWDKRFDVIVSLETIEHLANPEFFLNNAYETAGMLIVSTPIGEFKGYNPHHKQVWTLPEFRRLIERWFDCSYYRQKGEQISSVDDDPCKFVIAVGTPKARARQSGGANSTLVESR